MRYILGNIPFFITLGVLALSLVLIFFTRITTPEHKQFLLHNIYLCSLLCLLTLFADLVFMTSEMTDGMLHFANMQGYWWGFVSISASYVFGMMALTGLYMVLKSIPFAGNVLVFTAWLILTVPARLYYYVTNMTPTSQDLLALFTIKLDTTLGTVLPLVSMSAFFRAVIPNIVALVLLLICTCRIKNAEASKRSWRVSECALGILLLTAYFINPKGLPILKDASGHSMKVINNMAREMRYYMIPRREPAVKDARTNPQDNIVFILDESIRGDYLSINNPGLNTTPELEKYLNDYPDNMFNYGLMLAAATHSFPSRSAVMNGQDNIPDNELHVFSNPTIFDLAKANGYRTILINVQGDFPDLLFRKADLERVDEVYLDDSAFDSYTNDPDFNAANFIHKRITEEKGLFIFLEKFGAHDPYEVHYPNSEPEYQVFMPKLEPYEWYSLAKRRRVINSYKNCVRYNLGGFFGYLLGNNPLELEDCTILYTSDHGQSFMEYGQLESHLTGYLEQAIVPFLMFSTDSWVLSHLRKPDEISGTLHHLNIDPTIYSMLYRISDYSLGKYQSLLSSNEWVNPPLVYLVRGSFWDGTPSQPLSTDINRRLILPLDKYMY